jgi:hypothetical protein
MSSLQAYKRRAILPLTVLALTAYFSLVFLPLQRRAESLDTPLRKAWQQLSAALEQTNIVMINFGVLTNQLRDTREALARLDAAKHQALARIELPPAVRARTSATFQLVDYENERSKQLDELAAVATRDKITVEPALYAGFPQHTADVVYPPLLWAELAMVESLVKSALFHHIPTLHSVEVEVAATNAPALGGVSDLSEIPIQFEFTSPIANAVDFIQSLPLRPDEMVAHGFATNALVKPPLFVQRMIIKRQTPEKTDEVRVSLRVLGFVYRQ